MSLKLLVSQKIMTEVIRNRPSGTRKTDKVEWRVLIVDKMSMRMISAVTKMHDLSAEGITLVEDITKSREPLPSLESTYLISPTEESIRCLMRDYENKPLYKAAHVFFTEAVPDNLFEMLGQSKAVRYMQTCKEINIAFIACEAQVFSLDLLGAFKNLYSPNFVSERVPTLERIAEQVATLCATLGEYPAIRYRDEWTRNNELANMVQAKLDGYKADDPTMGEGIEKSRSQLLIIDRGFDCMSPVLHELTLQAMAYDLLDIDNDVYKYVPSPNAREKEVLLDEHDDFWVKLRHQHIAEVSTNVTQNLKSFTEDKRMNEQDKASVRDLGQMIKKMPQYQKELSKYSTHLHLAEDCMQKYQSYINKLCNIEQDLAMGADADGEKIKDHIPAIVPILLNQSISNHDKVRIIALFCLARGGIPEAHLDKLMQHAQLEEEERSTIKNIQHLGANVIADRNNQKGQMPRKNRDSGQPTFKVSRWIPVVKDVMEDCIEGTLDRGLFPFLNKKSQQSGYTAPTSARYGNWHNREKAQTVAKNLPRLIIFIVGGCTYSEIRCAYEVTNAVKNWEVIIGSTHILTPKSFLNDLKSL